MNEEVNVQNSRLNEDARGNMTASYYDKKAEKWYTVVKMEGGSGKQVLYTRSEWLDPGQVQETDILEIMTKEKIMGRIFSDQPGKFVIEMSSDNYHWDKVQEHEVTAETSVFFEMPAYLSFLRITHTNGPDNPAENYQISVYAL